MRETRQATAWPPLRLVARKEETMPVRTIRAYVECDQCGLQFSVAIEETSSCPLEWSMYDMAIDAVRGSLEYEEVPLQGGRLSGLISKSSSIQNGQILCAECTRIEDAKHAGE